MSKKSEVAAVERKEKNASAESGSKDSPAFDLTLPEWYLNWELTWLECNRRVLHEADRRPETAGRGRGAQINRGRSYTGWAD